MNGVIVSNMTCGATQVRVPVARVVPACTLGRVSSKCAAMMPVVHHAAHKQGSRRSLIVRAETEDIDLEMDLGEKTRPDTGEDIDVDMDYGYDDGKISFEDIVVGENYVARVVNIVAFGIFVNFNADTDALVHISEIADAYVSNINDYVSIGDQVTVRVINKDAQRSRVAASIKQSGIPVMPKEFY